MYTDQLVSLVILGLGLNTCTEGILSTMDFRKIDYFFFCFDKRFEIIFFWTLIPLKNLFSHQTLLSLPGWNVHLPDFWFLRRLRIFTPLPHFLRMHCHLMGFWSEQILRRNQGNDWLLPNFDAEVLLGCGHTCYMYCELNFVSLS